MSMNDPLITATSYAVGHARSRSDAEVSLDDLLLGALQAVGRLGVATFDNINIDLSGMPLIPETSIGTSAGPSYSTEAAAAFDRASAIARLDRERKVRLVHLLAALGQADGPMMRDLKQRYGFDELSWRSALAEWDREREQRTRPLNESLLSVDDAAEALGVHAQTMRSYIRAGKLPAYRLGGERSIRVFTSDLYGLLEPLEPAADDETG